jgi:iron complex outermembrane receptor protein
MFIARSYAPWAERTTAPTPTIRHLAPILFGGRAEPGSQWCMNRPSLRAFMAAVALTPLSVAAGAQNRSSENAVTGAEDAFGFSIGRESLGIYDSGNVRGFSPTAAGNLRIDGLYFSPVVGLTELIVESQSIKVGLSAQGYPFAAPSGIVDQSLRRPTTASGASVILNGDSRGTAGIELDGSVPLSSTLAVRAGYNGGRTHFDDGTRNRFHSEALVARWRPAANIEVVPFWSAFTDIDDNSSPVYVPAGEFIPPEPRAGRYTGPKWNRINRTLFNYGVVASAELSPTWLLRVGAFRSIRHLRTGFTNLIENITPAGAADRTLFADPPSSNSGISGEVRLTHVVAEGPRLHTLHFSLRGRDNRREFGGEEEIDLGRSSIFAVIDPPRPNFRFGAQSHDHLREWIYGIAYDGRWKDVGELSFGISKTAYRKATASPDLTIVSRATPTLYNGTLTLLPFRGVAVYGGFSRGFEESGSPPASAVNRSDALPAIITRQVDGGVRVHLAPKLSAVAGLFSLQRPYFGFDSANFYVPIGTTRSRGAEFSISGNLTNRLTLVAGGVLLDARVQASRAAVLIGGRPVGIPGHIVSIDANWSTPVAGLSLDANLAHRGKTPATTDNLVQVPARVQVDLGGRYSFKLRQLNATARIQIGNLFDSRGFTVAGPGAYAPNGARAASAQLTVDL